MSVATSVVNKQSASVDKLIIPYGLNLGTSPNLTAELGKLAFNLTDNSVYASNGSIWSNISAAGTGDVVGPGASTDNAIVRFDSTTGKLVQNSVVTIGDTGAIAGILTLNAQPVATGTNTGDVTLSAVGASPNANGGSLSGQALTLQPASASFPGVVTAVAQVIAGQKTMNDGLLFTNATASYTPTLLNFYEVFTTSYSFTGCASITLNVTWTRIGNLVNLTWLNTGGGLGTATTVAGQLSTAAGAVPTRFLAANQSACVPVINGALNTSITTGNIFFLTGGAINFAAEGNTDFPFPGFCGMIAGGITYSV